MPLSRPPHPPSGGRRTPSGHPGASDHPDPPDPIPSPRARALIRSATTELLRDPDPLFAAVDSAVLGTQSRAARNDRELAEAIRASSRSNLTHWATYNLAAPGQRVPVNPAPEPVALAKLFALRGLDDTSQSAYGAGQNATWPFWMTAVFSLTSDAAELKEVLEISAWSIFSFVEVMVNALHEAIELERGLALSSTNNRRLVMIRELLEQPPVSVGRAGQELGYPVDIFSHTAAIVWSERNGGDALLAVAERLADGVRARLRRRPLTVMATPDLVWAWFPSDSLDRDLHAELREAAQPGGPAAPPPGVQIAIGPTEPSYHGFQESHADALLTRRLMRATLSRPPVAAYRDIELLAVATADPDRAQHFTRRMLGTLVLAGPEVTKTLRVYLQNRCSPSQTARASFTHRNTVIDRVRRAESHLSVPIAGNELALAMALELDHWLGQPGWSRLSSGDGI